MLKLVKNIDEATKRCHEVFAGTDTAWALSQGYEEQDVEQAYTSEWYVTGYAPAQPEPTYQEKRMAEYPPTGEQLDMMYWDKVNGTNVWQETITAIKNKYPKN